MSGRLLPIFLPPLIQPAPTSQPPTLNTIPTQHVIMKPTEMCTGQKVTIFRRLSNVYSYINDKVGQIGTITEMCYDPDIYTHYAEVQLKDGSSEWFPAEMIELTPAPDQIKDGVRIQIADARFSPNLEYAGTFGTIVSPLYGYDNNVDVLPDDPSLRAKWGTITLSGLNRFRILEQAPKESCKFRDVCGRLEIQPSQYESISYTLHLDGDITPSELRDKLNKFIDKMEECIQ